MPTHSAGILLHRRATDGTREVFLVHPGGPFWARKDEHAWSIPKGEFEPDAEEAWDAARREWAEETGLPLPDTEPVALAPFRASGKVIHAFAVAGDVDPAALVSNLVELEWPPRSGRRQPFPEVDRGAWFTLDDARTRLHKGQVPLADQLADLVG